MYVELKVNWDSTYEGMDFPLRVSPWSVEPVEISNNKKHMAAAIPSGHPALNNNEEMQTPIHTNTAQPFHPFAPSVVKDSKYLS